MKNSRLKKNVQNAQVYNFFNSNMLSEIEDNFLMCGLFCGM